MREYPDTPLIKVQVNGRTVDTIFVSGSAALGGWKIDGRLEGALAAPDQLQDHFDAVVSTLAEYVDHSSTWTNCESGHQITPWAAMVLLTRFDEQG